MQKPLEPMNQMISPPQTTRVRIAMPAPGNVSQKPVVCRCSVNSGDGWPNQMRSSVGQMNMWNAATNGISHRKRARIGLGRRPNLFRTQLAKSWYATTWHAQPQKKRPRIRVARIDRPKRTNPALT